MLERLHAAGLSLADAALDTRKTQGLTREERRLDLGLPWPVDLSASDDIANRIGRAQERHGKGAGAKGGNPTRRVRLWIEGEVDLAAVVRALVGGAELER